MRKTHLHLVSSLRSMLQALLWRLADAAEDGPRSRKLLVPWMRSWRLRKGYRRLSFASISMISTDFI